MATTDTVKVTYLDASGDTAVGSFSVLPAATDENIALLIDELQALSDLEIISWTRIKEHQHASPVGPADLGTGHMYADDKAAMVIRFHTGNSKVKVTASLPGPIEDMVTKNDFAFEASQTETAAACAALATWLTTRSGEAITTPKDGAIRIYRGKRAAK